MKSASPIPSAAAASPAAVGAAPTAGVAAGIASVTASGSAAAPAAGSAAARPAKRRIKLPRIPSGAGGFALTAALFVAGLIVCFTTGVPVQSVVDSFSFNVLVIVISMDLFTNMLAKTGAMEAAALKLAGLSSGRQTALLVMLAAMMYLISAFLNNITAILVVLPCIFVLLKSITPDRRYLAAFFAVLLAMSNTGGASSAIGDLPAVLIMSTGVVSFSEYTFTAFPLMAITSIVVVGVWVLMLRVRRVPQDRDASLFAIGVLRSQYRFAEVDRKTAVPLAVILAAMFVCWIVVPQSVVPPEVIALVGCLVATVAYRVAGNKVSQVVDLGSVLTISGFLFLAAAVSATGVLEAVVAALQAVAPNQQVFIALVLLVASLIAGLVGAGPAAAACLPIVVDLATTTFQASSTFVMVAYGAAICAGSSLFLFSATAGYVLSGKVAAADLTDSREKRFTWSVGTYFAYGLVNYLIQMSIVMAVVLIFF